MTQMTTCDLHNETIIRLQRDLAAANAKLAAKPDVAGLVDAYDNARYHFEDWTGGADTPSKQAELKRRVDAKDAARQRIQDALLSHSAQLQEKEAECEGLKDDSRRYKWLANRVLACDYGDNDADGEQIGWRIRHDLLPKAIGQRQPAFMYGSSIDAAIDAAIAAKEQP